MYHRLDDESYMFERQPQLLHRLQVSHLGLVAVQMSAPSSIVAAAQVWAFAGMSAVRDSLSWFVM